MRAEVTIIMPARNSAGYITAAIKSVMSQTFTQWELLVVDDGSTDETAQKIKSLAQKDSRIIYFFQPQSGVVAAFNRALTEAKGMYVARLDSDDIWIDQTKLENQVRFLELNPDYGAVGTWAVAGMDMEKPRYYFRHPTTDSTIRLRVLLRNPIVSSSLLARTHLVKDCGGYDKQDGLAEDYGLVLRLGQRSKLANLPRLSVWYRINYQGMSQSTNFRQVSSAFQTMRRFRHNYPLYGLALIKWRVQIWLSFMFGPKVGDIIKSLSQYSL